MHVKADFQRALRERYVERTDRPTAERTIQVRLQDLAQERDRILTATAEFGRFLKENAIISMNDAFEGVLQTQIVKEEHARNFNQVGRLQDTLKEYQEKYMTVTRAELDGANLREVLSCEEVAETINGLFRLPINGGRIRELYEAAVEAHKTNNGEEED